MKIKVNKCGSNDKGVWIYGTADCGGLEITAIFSTNLKEPLKVGEVVPFKKIKIFNAKRYALEF